MSGPANVPFGFPNDPEDAFVRRPRRPYDYSQDRQPIAEFTPEELASAEEHRQRWIARCKEADRARVRP